MKPENLLIKICGDIDGKKNGKKYVTCNENRRSNNHLCWIL